MPHNIVSMIDLEAPVASIMTTQLLTVGPRDTLMEVKKLFDAHRIHHVPVVRFKHIVGMISKSDLQYFMRGMNDSQDAELESLRLQRYCAEDIMTRGLAKLDVQDKINVAIEIFRENLFHALPVLQNGELAGMVTTHDMICLLAELDNRRITAGKQVI